MSDQRSSNQLSGAAIDTLLCLFLHGPTWDGDVPSKLGRDELVRLGLASRRDGYQWLTDKGVHIGMERGYIERKEKRDRKVRKLMALPEAQQVRTVVIEHARPAVETSPVPVTTWKPAANGLCEHCGLSWFLHIVEDEQGRKDVCTSLAALGKNAESEEEGHVETDQ